VLRAVPLRPWRASVGLSSHPAQVGLLAGEGGGGVFVPANICSRTPRFSLLLSPVSAADRRLRGV